MATRVLRTAADYLAWVKEKADYEKTTALPWPFMPVCEGGSEAADLLWKEMQEQRLPGQVPYNSVRATHLALRKETIQSPGGEPQASGKPATIPAEAIGQGVAPRDAKFLEWYEAVGTETYHKPVKCWRKWEAMSMEQRAAICPDAPGKIAKATVAKAILRALWKRDGKKGAKPKRKARVKR
jgi:hypothetical protein